MSKEDQTKLGQFMAKERGRGGHRPSMRGRGGGPRMQQKGIWPRPLMQQRLPFQGRPLLHQPPFSQRHPRHHLMQEQQQQGPPGFGPNRPLMATPRGPPLGPMAGLIAVPNLVQQPQSLHQAPRRPPQPLHQPAQGLRIHPMDSLLGLAAGQKKVLVNPRFVAAGGVAPMVAWEHQNQLEQQQQQQMGVNVMQQQAPNLNQVGTSIAYCIEMNWVYSWYSAHSLVDATQRWTVWSNQNEFYGSCFIAHTYDKATASKSKAFEHFTLSSCLNLPMYAFSIHWQQK